MGSSSSKSKSSSNQRSAPPSNAQGFFKITDNFRTIEEVQRALRAEGLESSNLIVAVDYTKSNEWTGKHSFGGQCLHHIDDAQGLNPYQHAISIIGRTLSAFDDDNLIPVYGFGDVTSRDNQVFSFHPGDVPCQGLDSVLWRYREITPTVKLSGPTSFAPAILQAMKIVAESGGQYHILVLVADGQVTRSSDMPAHILSPQERDTVNAIVAASQLPLSIVMIGVGDGPWDLMNEFDDKLPSRKFDNFQFVQLTDIAMKYRNDVGRLEAQFALAALMEIPEQYKLIQRLGMLGRPPSRPVPMPPRPPLPPPYQAMPHNTHLPPVTAMGQPSMMASPSFAGYSGPPAGMMPSQSFGGAQTSAGGGMMYGKGGPPDIPMPGPKGGMPEHHGGDLAPQAQGVDPLFLCPITQEPMRDPVLACDGYTYERQAIEKWLQTHDTSPMTNGVLAHKNLTPNHALRSSIQEAIQRSNSARR